jgi:uncharacterized protein
MLKDPATSPPLQPLRLVLDTQVWLDLLLFDDPRCAALASALHAGQALALVDSPCRDEWRRVLGYPALRLSLPQQDALGQRFDAMTVQLDTHAQGVEGPALRCRDPDDQKFLALAHRGQAQALLSRDQALLELAGRARRQGLFEICQPEQWRLPAEVRA